MIKLLINKGANINALDTNFLSALDAASDEGIFEKKTVTLKIKYNKMNVNLI